MKTLAVVFVLLMGAAFGSSAVASDKVQTIQVMVREECNKKLSFKSALAMIRPLYLTCVPGTTVSLNTTCELKCLKANSGVVIGR